MTPRTLICLLFFICNAVLCSAQGNRTDGPVRIELLSHDAVRPPLQTSIINLFISNESDSLKWYIFPYYLNESLPEDGIFNAYDNWETQYIVGRKYPEALDTFQIIEIGFIGPDKFVAFCLGPKSNIVYERYSMSSWGDSQYREVDYWEVENLMVNGETPFDKWLPYDVVCSTGSLLNSSHASYGCLNLNWNKETSGSRTDYPKESVSHIQAVGIRKLRVRFEE